MDLSPSAQVFDRAASTYDAVGVDFFADFGRRLVDLAEVQTGQSVLDVGTGRGAVLGPAAHAAGPAGRVVGVDLAPTMVELTAADFATQANVRVMQADATDLPQDLGTFDHVLSSLVIFFSDDPAATLAHWAKFLKPGGQMGLVTFVDDPDDGGRMDEVVKRYIDAPAHDATQSAESNPFRLVRDTNWLDASLYQAGMSAVRATTVRHLIRFADLDQWWAWVWSHGMRQAMEMIPPDAHDAFRGDAARELQHHRLPDGGFGYHTGVRFTLGRVDG